MTQMIPPTTNEWARGLGHADRATDERTHGGRQGIAIQGKDLTEAAMSQNSGPTIQPRILVVDDEPDLLDELSIALSCDDWHVVQASAATDALRQLAADPDITVLLTDLRMPKVGGIELTREARAHRDESHALEVVLLTGHGTMENAAEAVRVGAFDFIFKPVDMRQLLDVTSRAHQSAIRRRELEKARQAELARLRSAVLAADWQSDFATGVPRELASILSHELRTPLMALMGVPEVLGSAANLPADAIKDNLVIVREAGGRLTEIADDFVELMVPPDPASITPRPVHVASILRDLSLRMAQAANRAGQTLTTVSETDGVCETDPARLIGALARLVTNAIVWSPTGGEVTLTAREEQDGRVAFEVTDHGPGMTEADVRLALQPFRQLDMSSSRRTGGLGLGLPLADRMARCLGGELRIVPSPGVGTRATIALPRHRPRD
jgi:signal transduction histidine kinase